jgi:hypothetical protein
MLESHDGAGTLTLPTLSLRSSLEMPPSTETLRATPLPPAAKPLLKVAAQAAAQPAAKRQRQAVWTAASGCLCADKPAHEKYVRQCRAFPCTCKPQQGSYRGGGDYTHLNECVRGRFQKHGEGLRKPAKGEKVQMIGEARRCGGEDLVFDGSAWVVDPSGRPIIFSAWMGL